MATHAKNTYYTISFHVTKMVSRNLTKAECPPFVSAKFGEVRLTNEETLIWSMPKSFG